MKMSVWLLARRARTDAGHPDIAEVHEIEPKIALDDQTGKPFEIVPETRIASIFASISATYLICALGFLLWLLFDTWSGRNLLLGRLGYDKVILASASFRLMAFVAIGGAMGGMVNGIRSIISWHSERRA